MKAIDGYTVKLKNPARRVMVALLDNGKWVVQFKMVAGRREVNEVKFILSDEAMGHMINMACLIREEQNDKQ